MESKYAGMSPYNYCENNPVMLVDPSGMGPTDWGEGYKDNGPKTKSIAKPDAPKMPPVNIPGKVDNARDVRSGNVKKALLVQEAAKNQAKNQRKAIQEEMQSKAYWDTRFLSQSRNGELHNVSRREIAKAEHDNNEAYGEAVRNGGMAVGLGYALGGKEGAMKGAVIDGVMMSFANVGTPYGKVELMKPIEEPFVPYTESPLKAEQKISEAPKVLETEQIPPKANRDYVINRNGLSIWQDEDAGRYLEGNGNAAYMATEDGGIMILKPGATIQEIYEEEIHHTQRMEHGMDYFLRNRTLLEIQAQDILLQYGKANGWRFEELIKIQTAKDTWLKIYKTEQNGR